MSLAAVHACGMVTALGFNAPSSLAALRAGISAIGETPWVDTESGEPLSGAKVSLPHWWEGVGKLADLVAPAIHECMEAAAREGSGSVPILLGVAPPSRPGRFHGIDHELLENVEHRLGMQHDPRSRLFAQDQAGCAYAILAACEMLRSHTTRRVVVAGVDSFLHQDTLDGFIQQRRIMTPGNSNGFFPGEAGCAVLIGPDEPGTPGLLHIEGCGFARESATIESTQPLRAVGLTTAVRDALASAGVSMSEVAYRLTDLSGEHYKFKEAAFVVGRLDSGDREGAFEIWHPIEYLGHIGAAVLPCLLAQAMHAGQEGYAPGPIALCHVGNDDGERAAFVVSQGAHS